MGDRGWQAGGELALARLRHPLITGYSPTPNPYPPSPNIRQWLQMRAALRSHAELGGNCVCRLGGHQPVGGPLAADNADQALDTIARLMVEQLVGARDIAIV